jgi:phosphoglucomutase
VIKERTMEVHPFAGKLAEPAMLVNVPKLVTAYYTEVPDPSVPEQRVAFCTDGHRGSAFYKAFKEWHILTISQAICLYCNQQKMMAVARGMHSFRKKSQHVMPER